MPPVRARFYHRPSILLIGINSNLAALVLAELGVDSDQIGDWMHRQQERALSGKDAVPA
jgi:hypothetical protein